MPTEGNPLTLTCSISGENPKEPVVSSRSGLVFERRLIEQHLQTHGDVCPVTDEPLSLGDLIPLKRNPAVPPRPTSVTSIPALLGMMQSEWDALMAETFHLKQQSHEIRQQLSHALYRHDAACRVIARLMREKDALKRQLTQIQEQRGTTGGPAGAVGTSGEVVLPEELIEAWKTLAKTLLAQRKKRFLGNVVTKEKVAQWHEVGSYCLHSTLTPGVTCCTINHSPSEMVSASASRLWTGGEDGTVIGFDLKEKRTVARLVGGHMKRVNKVIAHPQAPALISCSNDKTVRVWGTAPGAEDWRTSWILRAHDKPVESISLHPSGNYFLSASSRERRICVADFFAGSVIRTFRGAPTDLRDVAFHPDGMLIGAAGGDGKIYVYDIKAANDDVMVALEGHGARADSLCFSENGYYLATASFDEGKVRLWDLRKSANFETLDLKQSVNGSPSFVRFDHSGLYLAIGGEASASATNSGFLAIYAIENKTTLTKVTNLDGHTARCNDACFGANADFLVSASADKTVRMWSAS